MSDPDFEEFNRVSYELMLKIGQVCEGQDIGVTLAAMTRIIAKMTATSVDPKGIEKVLVTLKLLHEDELKEIKNAN